MPTRILCVGIAVLMFACAAETDVSSSSERAITFEEFRAAAYQEPWEGGAFIVDGDVVIPNERRLHELYLEYYGGGSTALIVHQASGADAAWNDAQAKALTYCVSTGFGARYAEVVAAMDAATAEWEASADIDFIHLEEEDGACTAANERVVFDVRLVTSQPYLARAFFPNYMRASRNVLIDSSSFSHGIENLTLTGILRHELGHTLGFRHEHTRPESGVCYEDSSWRALTEYDRASVMHYPQCNGTGLWGLEITDLDRQGAAALYGAPTEEPPPPPPSVGSSHRAFVTEGETRIVGPFVVTPHTTFVAVTRGELGNADLYVRFDEIPVIDQVWDCRPLDDSSNEECNLDVPADSRVAYVAVHGISTAAVDIEIAYHGPAFEGVMVDDLGSILEVANTASLETLDDEIALNARAASNIVAARPIATFADLDAVSYVGPSALGSLHAYANDPSPDDLILQVANTASFETLDVDVGLDRRAAENIVSQRPFASIEVLDAVPYVGPSALDALRVWATGGSEPPPPSPSDDDARILEVANTATFDELDLDAGLDVRAAQNIVNQRPFTTLEELDAVPFVGPSALAAMLDYANR